MIAPVLPAWAIAVTALSVGAIGGGAVTAAFKNVELLGLREQHAAARAAADREALQRLQAAIARGDQLTHELNQASADTLALQDRLDHELARATTGRACLGADALRLLDRAARPAAVPAPAGRTARADAAQPAAPPAQRGHGSGDGDAASDTDVARWANAAYARYAQCAQRLDALIRWHQPAPISASIPAPDPARAEDAAP
ncbi:hypothetical protein [Thauera aromatica]|uniref:hypothetical protein n=1 Tax=Thauera aromatica TaxID=59405 RepID=UPI001FFC3171|nr:hypothetical protein [Thauera aromatica]MCK2095647.1 hypothetical protein [Thauera aromatica]